MSQQTWGFLAGAGVGALVLLAIVLNTTLRPPKVGRAWCRRCHRRVFKDPKFCPFCGNKLRR